MHIKTEPCPEAGAHESYHVIVCEDDEDETPASVLGHLTRADDSATSWTLKFLNPDSEGREAETFEAATLEEACAAIGKKFMHLKVDANRLSLGAMSQFVDDLMDPVIALAERTGSVTAMIHALVHVIGRVIANRLPEKSHAAVQDLITRQLARDIAGYSGTRAAHKQFAEMLQKKIEEAVEGGAIIDLFSGDEDDATPKH